MRKILTLLIVCFLFLSACNSTEDVNGRTQLTINQAVKKFEELSQHKVLLPKGIIPYNFTQSYGVINAVASRLELIYLNEKNRSETLRLYVQSATGELIQEHGDQEFTLKDGTKVIYRPYFPSAYAIEFQKKGLNYILGLSKNATNKSFDPKKLLNIANKME